MAEITRRQFYTTLSPEEIGHAIERYLQQAKEMYTEGTTIDNGYFVQAKGQNNAKRFIGMDLATQVQILSIDGTILVEIGQGKWSDKIGAGVAGLVLFAPLAITAAVGAWRQSQLPEEILNEVHHFITMSNGGMDPNFGQANMGYSNDMPGQGNGASAFGAQSGNSSMNNINEIKAYKELLDMGIITPEEFAAKKKELLGL